MEELENQVSCIAHGRSNYFLPIGMQSQPAGECTKVSKYTSARKTKQIDDNNNWTFKKQKNVCLKMCTLNSFVQLNLHIKVNSSKM